ncbi:MAG: UvrD-helicase domain-containing protein, partial [Candidatus Gracilibacteria bacterium]|nr:UvrD-helicase domain-containing protein [Candidatus Gracilibacteria bacterium]
MQLNPEQEKAKNTIDGPLLILAGAGSGKTATLTARIEHMIKNVGVNPSFILAVTFTNKAAKEMKIRVGKVLGIDYQINPYKNRGLPLVGTFHSIGVFILKEKIETIGYNKDFVIYDESDKLSVIKSIIKEDLKLDEKKYPPRSIASFISNAKNSLITAEKYQNYVDSHIKEIVNQVYIIYTKKLNENNALDFDDILVKTLDILKIPENLEYYQERYKYIMVDEYQDTNAPQYEIIKLLASKYRNLAVVGDDWQSIYSWRGADMKNIINFKKDYPEAIVIKLEQNYRSTKHIINSANELIKNNKSSISKTLFTENEIGEKIIYIDALSDRIESKTIAKIIKEKGNYNNNLILYRTNSQSRALEEALMIEAIPYKVIGGLKFYDRMEVKDMISYLRVIHNPNDVVAIKRVINTPSRKIGSTSLQKIDEYRNNFGVNYLQIFENITEVDDLNSGAKKAVFGFYEILLDLMEKSKTLVVADLLDYIIKKINYEEYLKDDATKEEYEARIQNLDELKNVASTYNGMDPRDSLSQFLEEVSLITDMDSKDNISNFVTLMTIHTSKGLEFERVFITGLEEGLFPSSRTFNEPSELEEERRLMYVAMTRAKKELYISKASERFQYGNYINNP